MTSTSPALRVECLLELARRVADPGDPLGREARARLAVTTGLAPEGVELALAHLEGRGDLPSLGLLLARAEPVARCWVVLSANVCTAALRALCFATACAPRVLVRPSRRDPVLAELLVREAANRGPFAVEAGAELGLVSQLAAEPGDLVHAYGSDETLGRLASTLPEGVSLRAHGTGLSVAVVGGGASLEAAAAALAADVVPFDQAGCLSPRIAFVG